MRNAKDLNFDFNDSGRGILHTGSYGPNTKMKTEVEDGNNVELKKGEITIKIHEVKKNLDGTYSGIVKNVSPYKSLSKDGIDEGTMIIFFHEHIFSCSH